MSEILIVDDERAICEVLSALVEMEGHLPLVASTGRSALEVLERQRPPVVLLDVRLPDTSGLELLRSIAERWPATVVIVMTAYGTVATAMEAMRLGAFEYLGKPLDLTQIRGQLRRAVAHADSPPPTTRATVAGPVERELIGRSPAMQEVFKLMGLLVSNDLTVLITGESGVGKELVAQGIHDNGPRRGSPFVAVNCAAIPGPLLESELFGHEKGAFTGAAERKPGRFEAAADGTLFLDEIGELSYEVQSKLLRALQERRFEALGSNRPVALRARVIAATNRDLAAEVAAGRFREDLFHRINLVHLTVPPLRRRRSDVALLARHFLAAANHELGRQLAGLDDAAMQRLERYDWPGNVRELENVIRKSVLLTQGNRITTADLQLPRDGPAPSDTALQGALGALDAAVRAVLERLVEADGHAEGPYRQVCGRVERTLVEAALQRTGGNQVAAARLLQVNRTTLRGKLKPDGDRNPA